MRVSATTPTRSRRRRPAPRRPLTAYRPELATWALVPTPEGFRIEDPSTRRPVCTVIISPGISPQPLGDLLARAPQLWRRLRSVAPLVEQNADGVPRLALITDLLWWAAGRCPYGPRDTDGVSEMRLMEAMTSEGAAASA